MINSMFKERIQRHRGILASPGSTWWMELMGIYGETCKEEGRAMKESVWLELKMQWEPVLILWTEENRSVKFNVMVFQIISKECRSLKKSSLTVIFEIHVH